MADKNARLQKAQAEIRKLKQENDSLRIAYEELRAKANEEFKRETKESNSSAVGRSIFLYMYDIIVSALILVFVYWITINGYENFDVPYICFCALVISIMLKCLIDNKRLGITPLLRVFLNDLIKPALSMLMGLFMCMICLGEAWKWAKNYAVDVAYTVILVVFVIVTVMIFVLPSYLIKKRTFNREKDRKG